MLHRGKMLMRGSTLGCFQWACLLKKTKGTSLYQHSTFTKHIKSINTTIFYIFPCILQVPRPTTPTPQPNRRRKISQVLTPSPIRTGIFPFRWKPVNRTTSPAIRRSPRKPKAKKRRDYNKDIDEDTEAIDDEDEEDIIEDRQSDSPWRPGKS